MGVLEPIGIMEEIQKTLLTADKFERFQQERIYALVSPWG
jgi:hypothetical protein